MRKILVLIVTHVLIGVIGFAAGIYALPIIMAPTSPTEDEIRHRLGEAEFQGQFDRDLQGSDFLHWGEGTVYVRRTAVAHLGRLAPGPDYKLYLSPRFVETEADFLRLKPAMVRVADVKTFDNFIVAVPNTINPADFNTVVIWCESFGQFISAAQYQ